MDTDFNNMVKIGEHLWQLSQK